MRYFIPLFLVAFLITGVRAEANLGVLDNAEYDACILYYIRGAKEDLASRLIRKACYENYKSPLHISSRRRAHNQCLLVSLQNVESVNATLEIKSACERRYLRWWEF